MRGTAKETETPVPGIQAPQRIPRHASPLIFLLLSAGTALLFSWGIEFLPAFQTAGPFDPPSRIEIESWGFTWDEYLSLVRKQADLLLKENKLARLGEQADRGAVVIEVAPLSEQEAHLVAQGLIEPELYARRAAVHNLTPEQFRRQGIHTRMVETVRNELDSFARSLQEYEQELSTAMNHPTKPNQNFRPPAGDPPGGDFVNAGTVVRADSRASGDAGERSQAKPPAGSDVPRQDPGFQNAGTNVNRPDQQSETVTYFERPWMPVSWRTSGSSLEVRVNVFEAASRLGWAAALAEFTDGTADPIIADHLKGASTHVLAVNRNAFGPLRPWPDWQQIQARHEEWARRISQGSRASRDYFRKGLPDTILGHAGSLARALAYQAAGQLEQRENCDSYYFRIGFHLAYSAQAWNLAAEGRANGVPALWVQRAAGRGQSNAQTAVNYIQDLRKVKPATGYCIDLASVLGSASSAAGSYDVPGENAASAIKAWNEAIALLSGAGIQGDAVCSSELEGMWISSGGDEYVVRFTRKGDAYEGVFTHVNPNLQRMGHQPGKPYLWVQRVDDRSYQGRRLTHRWPGHQGDYWPYQVTVFGDYFATGAGQVWRRVAPSDTSKIQTVREGQDYFVIPGYPRIRSLDAVPDCRKGPVPGEGRGPGEGSGNSIRLLNQTPAGTRPPLSPEDRR